MIPKFRVWDKKTKSMWNIERWHVEDEYFDLIEPNKSVADPSANRVWRKQSDVIPMQSIGLFDNSEPPKEIFEGDVVETIYGEKIFTGVIVYDQEETDFKATNGRNEYGNNFCYLGGNDSNIVIGNVHQHPELLKNVAVCEEVTE